jgi:hypothetical protein
MSTQTITQGAAFTNSQSFGASVLNKRINQGAAFTNAQTFGASVVSIVPLRANRRPAAPLVHLPQPPNSYSRPYFQQLVGVLQRRLGLAGSPFIGQSQLYLIDSAGGTWAVTINTSGTLSAAKVARTVPPPPI